MRSLLPVNRRPKRALTQFRCNHQNGACNGRMCLSRSFRGARGIRWQTSEATIAVTGRSERPLIAAIVVNCTEIASEPLFHAYSQSPLHCSPSMAGYRALSPSQPEETASTFPEMQFRFLCYRTPKFRHGHLWDWLEITEGA
jgi:hypothetical protein